LLLLRLLGSQGRGERKRRGGLVLDGWGGLGLLTCEHTFLFFLNKNFICLLYF
jgi:hypothetical protein